MPNLSIYLPADQYRHVHSQLDRDGVENMSQAIQSIIDDQREAEA